MHVSDEIMSEALHFVLIGTIHGMQNWRGIATAQLKTTQCRCVLQARPAQPFFRVMQTTYEKSDLHAGNMKFATQNEE